jgi:hypothetical protein
MLLTPPQSSIQSTSTALENTASSGSDTMSSPRIPELLESNKVFAETWKTPFTMEQLRPNIKEALMVG